MSYLGARPGNFRLACGERVASEVFLHTVLSSQYFSGLGEPKDQDIAGGHFNLFRARGGTLCNSP